jgi:hypothetical protein
VICCVGWRDFPLASFQAVSSLKTLNELVAVNSRKRKALGSMVRESGGPDMGWCSQTLKLLAA